MSIDKHFEKRGVELSDDNTLPSGQRSQRNVKRLIAAVRAAESEFNDELRAANDRCRIAQEKCIEYQARVANLENELRGYKLKEKLEAMENLSVSDRKLLLTAS